MTHDHYDDMTQQLIDGHPRVAAVRRAVFKTAMVLGLLVESKRYESCGSGDSYQIKRRGLPGMLDVGLNYSTGNVVPDAFPGDAGGEDRYGHDLCGVAPWKAAVCEEILAILKDNPAVDEMSKEYLRYAAQVYRGEIRHPNAIQKES